jgi:hypothetical protein
MRAKFSEFQPDRFNHSFEIAKYLFVGEPQNRITVRPQYQVPSFIPRNFRFRRMSRAIDFDDQPRLVAREVNNEAAQLDLPTKSKPLNPMPAKRRPKLLLGRGLMASQVSRHKLQVHGQDPPYSRMGLPHSPAASNS